jgi:competence protein ComEA
MVVDFRTAPDPAAPRGPRWRLGVGAVVVLVLALLAVTVAISATATRGGAGETAITSPPTAGAGGAAPSGSPGPPGSPGASGARGSSGSPVFVHVHGRVASPGLYELAASARVVDVVAAAGGFAEDADQGALNLARPLVDGEQLYVPVVGEAAPDGAAGGGGGDGAAPGGVAGSPVDLNAADAAALETLPGVGPATSAAILEWREQNGSFRSVDDLLGVSGIGEKTLEKLAPLVTV